MEVTSATRWPKDQHSDYCTHGLHLTRVRRCIDCEIVWEESCIRSAERSLERHQRKLAELREEKARG